MAKTRQQVCIIASRELGLAPVSQAADGGTFAVIQAKFDGVLADLQARQIVAWGTDETPDECADALAIYVAQKCAVSAGAGGEIRDALLSLGQKPFFDLVAVAGRKWSGQPTKADRF